MRSARSSLAAGLLVALASGPVLAQAPPGDGGSPDTSADGAREPEGLPPGVDRLLRERERERLNPADDPLRVVGIDESGSDFRRRTPSLERALAQPLPVDQDELRERQLAMFSGSGGFDGPPRTLAPEPDAAPADASRVPATRGARERGDEPGTPWVWVLVIAAGAAVLALRRRA